MPWAVKAWAALRAGVPVVAVVLAAAGCRGCDHAGADARAEAGAAAQGDASPEAAAPPDPDGPPRARLDPALAPPASSRYLPRRTSTTTCVFQSFAGGTIDGEPEIEMRYTLDDAGRPLVIEHTDDPRARATVMRRTLDGAGRPVKTVVETRGSDEGPSVEELGFTLEVSGRVVLLRTTSSRDDAAFANARAYEFDAEGRVVGVDEDQEGEALETRCRYIGQWPSRIERLSRGRTSVQDFTYDAEGRLLGYVIRSAGEVHGRVVTARGDEGFTDAPAPGDTGRGLDVYEGNCAEIFFSPCSTALAPPAPAGPAR